jgi:hypothetical protein
MSCVFGVSMSVAMWMYMSFEDQSIAHHQSQRGPLDREEQTLQEMMILLLLNGRREECAFDSEVLSGRSEWLGWIVGSV